MQRWLKRHTLSLWFLLSLLLVPVQVQAQTDSKTASAAISSPNLSPSPFKAFYAAEFDLGINISGTATRQLQPLDNGRWQLSMHASAVLASIDESSRFELRPDQRLLPQHYNYQRKLIGKKKQRELTFDWQNNHIASRYNDHTQRIKLEPDTLDTISYQFQLWNDMKAGMQSVDYRVADNGRIKDYRFNRLGDETVETPAGQFETIKVARDRGKGSGRQTYIWFAKAHEHVIVKLEQIETDGKRYSLLLERLE